jgi:hypothetical protein
VDGRRGGHEADQGNTGEGSVTSFLVKYTQRQRETAEGQKRTPSSREGGHLGLGAATWAQRSAEKSRWRGHRRPGRKKAGLVAAARRA